MSFTPEQVAALDAPLSKGVVKERKQGAAKVSYIEAWHAIAEANRIFGYDAWTRETVLLQETNRELVELRGDNGPYKQWRVGYLAKVRITAGGVVREGTGFGSGMGNPAALGDAIESAAKEAESDAMKRALMTFGNPFGLALYDKTKANVSDAPQAPVAAPPGMMTGAELLEQQQTLTGGRKSSSQAKKDGDDVKIKADIAKCDRDGLLDWHTNFDSYTAHLPASWLNSVRDMLELRREELFGEEAVAPEAEEMTEAFRGAVGPPHAGGLSGGQGHQMGASA